MPVRKIPKNYRYITGEVSARKRVGKAGHEASLEREFLLLQEFDPSVKHFEVQPIRVYWRDQFGRRRLYTPDCGVHYVDDRRKPMIYEVKFRSYLRDNWKELRPAYRAAVHETAREGSRFKIVTEEKIRTPYLERVKFLLPFVRRGTDTVSKQAVLAMIDKVKVITPRQLMARISSDPLEQAYLIPSLWYLIGTFQLRSDLSAPLTMDSQIESLS